MSNTGDADRHPIERTTTQSRQAMTGMGVRYVLAISTLMAFAALAVVCYFFVY